MGIITTFVFTSDTETVTRVKLNALAGNLITEFNGNIDNANIKAAAGIAASKLDLSTIAQNVAFTGTVDLSGATLSDAVSFDDVTATTIDINGGTLSDFTIDGDWTAAGETCADLGTITTATFTDATFTDATFTSMDCNGGTLDGVQIGGTTATGELIVNNASDEADGLGDQGDSGQVLTSAGAGANPTWETPSINSGLTLISKTTVTDAVNSGDIAITQGYMYKVFYTINCTSNTDIYLRLRFNSATSGYAGGGSNDYITISAPMDVEGSTGFAIGEFTMSTIWTDRMAVYGNGMYQDVDATMQSSSFKGWWDNSTTVTSFEVYAQGAYTGKILLYKCDEA